ncbi:uncharacterized protein LOC111346524 [Stylophora pistillata]|uniref:uncharacterized protein LOC111346524 n=1 Tax=Stylophora pistillata TaxID=50429 RepID=UPI000C0478D4|nr:uncharacterized protein LOC111346524 [Stylophora pistillata]
MDKILLLLGCVALFGLAQGYTLRDMLRERALRRYEAYDTNDYLATKYQREYDALRARALRTLREFHLRHMFDANFRMDEEHDPETNGIFVGHRQELKNVEILLGFELF